MRIVSGTTTESIYFVAFSTADHISRVTGHTTAGFNVYFSVANTTGTTQNIALKEINSTQCPGLYSLTIADSTITTLPAGVDSRELAITISGSMDTVTRTVELYRRCATTGQTLAINSSGKIADVESILSKVTSIESNTTGLVTKLTSVETDVDSVLTKVTSIETNTTGMVTKLSSVDTNVTNIKAETTAIKAKTDSLTFTVANQVRADVRYINGTQVQGTGTTVDTWRPV